MIDVGRKQQHELYKLQIMFINFN